MRMLSTPRCQTALPPNDALNAELEGMDAPSVLVDALNQLDTFPALLMRRWPPRLGEAGATKSLAVERKMGTRGVSRLARLS